jgi:HPt (histidine-containing phosphotransfer) domain-containing protein
MRFAAQPFVKSTPGSIDIRNIVSVCRDGDTLNLPLLREMLGQFIDENRRRMQTLAEAVEAGDRNAVGQQAHAVLGSAAMLGAGRLHDLSWSLVLDAKDNGLSALRLSVVALREELEAVVRALHAAHPEAWTE